MELLENSENGYEGRFYIYKYDENTVYKKIKKEIPNQKLLSNKIVKNFSKYKDVIENIYKSPFPTVKGYDVENDGSYKCKFINGYRLDRINNFNLKYNEIIKIKSAIYKLKDILNKNKLSGDWALHNLIYDINDDKIYNVDLEGFFSCPSLPSWGNINFINKWLQDCDNKLNEIISRTQYFTIILWNPTLFQSNEILQDIPNIIEKKEISISNDYLHKYIFDIYKFDTRCSHNIVLPPKIKKLKEYNNKHLIVKFIIDNPTYKNNICIEAVNLKEIIRKKYKSNIKNYTRGMMIHIADDLKQSKYIWEKNTENLNIIKLLIQEAGSPLRYKLSKIEKNGKDGWHTIDTMNVYESYIEGTEHFFVYRAANPRRYCLSKEKINDDNWEYYYDFYCKESEIDERITMYKKRIARKRNKKYVQRFSDTQQHGYVGHLYKSDKLIKTHKDCYNYILDTLNKNNIKFVIIRGFGYLPVKPDTDLDIIINPNSYEKFKEIYKNLNESKLIRVQHPTKYTENGKDFYYTPLFTAKHLKEGEHLPGNYYRFDTYSDLFFYKDGEGKSKNAIICNPLFKKYLFDNLIKVDNYYIPNPISEIILLIYRNLYDKRGKWCRKHMMRINELLLSINKDEFNKISIYCFTSKQNIYEHLITKNFDKISQPNQKLNLFIIRKKGMKREIIENILNQIQNEYQILDKILININNKKKFYSNFYGNYDKHKDDIEKNNDNQCLAIITNNPDDINPNELKQKIRKQYIKFYPPLGNIIHSSDSSNDCEKELEMLFNENIDNFKNIGTYYSQVDI